jgi:hypothetical protein
MCESQTVLLVCKSVVNVCCARPAPASCISSCLLPEFDEFERSFLPTVVLHCNKVRIQFFKLYRLQLNTLSCTMLTGGVTRRSLLRGAGCVLAPVAPRRVSVMAGTKSVLVPIGNGSEEMEAVICESMRDLSSSAGNYRYCLNWHLHCVS